MTKKQKIFADEYLIDLNATRAYKVAYPSVKQDVEKCQGCGIYPGTDGRAPETNRNNAGQGP